MGIAKLQVFISDVGDPCGTLVEERDPGRPTTVTVLDCDGVLRWPCGRFRFPGGEWERVPDEGYLNLPSRCGHVEFEVPPGCYWVLAGSVSAPREDALSFNGTTHVGIVQAACDCTVCVKLFNPTFRICWRWFREGLDRQAQGGRVSPDEVRQVDEIVEGLLARFDPTPREILLDDILRSQRG